MAPRRFASDFVEQCRREWRRLGVPGAVADEMAADLAADLKDAAADGLSPEEFLGSIAADPRSFAASWAAERGIGPAPAGSETAPPRPFVLTAFTALAAVAVIVAALLLATGEPKLSLVKAARAQHPPSGPPGTFVHGRSVVLQTSAAAPIEWILLVLALIALGFAAWLWSSRRRPQPPAGRRRRDTPATL